MTTLLIRRGAALLALTGLALLAPACSINREPVYEKAPEAIFADFANYPGLVAKVYAGLATTGQQGPAGKGDVKGLDEGFGQYTRALFNCQELTTDVAVVAWNDFGLSDMHAMTWNSTNQFPQSMFIRIFYQVSLCNEFLRQTTDDKLASNNISGANAETVRKYRAEVRFLRALSYWHAIDMFGNVPFVTENDQIGVGRPKRGTRAELFNYVETELLDIAGDNGALPNARAAQYGRADKGAAWMLLAKLYLNAEVYTGQAKNAECLTYCTKLINAGYTLNPTYRNLFLADNNTSPESIFNIPFDGLRTQTFGGSTFLVNATLGGDIDAAKARSGFGTTGTWQGLRTTKALVNLFPDTTTRCPDKRFLFGSLGQSLEINVISTFRQGFRLAKWRNLTSTGQPGSNVTDGKADIDIPLFRLADVYLMYAEAVLRGGGGNRADALNYVNLVRQRAYNATPGTVNRAGDITDADLTLDFLLKERARELYTECHRRTDLIRFGKFTSGYNWPWKGTVAQGEDVPAFRTLFPIPESELGVNPNLIQNDGY